MKKIIYLIAFLCMAVVTAHAQQEGKRKIADNVFVPKGQWIVGTSVSYSEHTEENYQFLVIDKFNSDGYTFKVSPLLVYGIKNNLALGGRFSYGRTLTRFDNVGFSLDDDLTIDLNDTYELTHSYSVMGIMRNYINLGSSKRFALYAETQLRFGGSQSKLVTKEGNEQTGTYSTSTDLGIGVSPGIVAFINNYTAVEVSVGVLGVDFSKTHQKRDQIYTGERSSSKANFHINIFSIGLGVAFYL